MQNKNNINPDIDPKKAKQSLNGCFVVVLAVTFFLILGKLLFFPTWAWFWVLAPTWMPSIYMAGLTFYFMAKAGRK